LSVTMASCRVSGSDEQMALELSMHVLSLPTNPPIPILGLSDDHH